MADHRPKILDILDLERVDRDIFRGSPLPSKLARTYGGQVAAQALVAATRTVSDEFSVHSLHGYFVGPGNPDAPTVMLVDRVRDGRSFVSRSVKVVQNGKAIFIMQASFHIRNDHGPEHSDEMRAVPDPESIVVDPKSLTSMQRLFRDEWADWDVRIVPPEDYEHNKYTASQQVVWFRTKTPLPEVEGLDADTLHVCTLAYMSDMTLLSSALVPHRPAEFQEASLDHAMWFLRPFRADEWLLYDQISPSAHGGRALTHGRIFNQQGDLVAVVTQEGLTRSLRDGASSVPLKKQ